MVLYVSVVEIAELAAIPEDHSAHGRVSGPVGSAAARHRVGHRGRLAIAHWFAFRIAAPAFRGESPTALDAQIGLAQLAAMVVAAISRCSCSTTGAQETTGDAGRDHRCDRVLLSHALGSGSTRLGVLRHHRTRPRRGRRAREGEARRALNLAPVTAASGTPSSSRCCGAVHGPARSARRRCRTLGTPTGAVDREPLGHGPSVHRTRFSQLAGARRTPPAAGPSRGRRPGGSGRSSSAKSAPTCRRCVADRKRSVDRGAPRRWSSRVRCGTGCFHRVDIGARIAQVGAEVADRGAVAMSLRRRVSSERHDVGRHLEQHAAWDARSRSRRAYRASDPSCASAAQRQPTRKSTTTCFADRAPRRPSHRLRHAPLQRGTAIATSGSRSRTAQCRGAGEWCRLQAPLRPRSFGGGEMGNDTAMYIGVGAVVLILLILLVFFLMVAP